jgi:hypothetical protein
MLGHGQVARAGYSQGAGGEMSGPGAAPVPPGHSGERETLAEQQAAPFYYSL